MSATPHQKEVLEYLSKVDSATKTEIYNNVKFGYFYNADKHFGDLLSRMVKNGMINRLKKGVYAINLSGKIINKEAQDPNQIKLL